MEMMDSVERTRLPERLQRREEERQREAEKKRQEKEGQAVQEEKSGYFNSSFGLERAAIEEALSGEDAGAEALDEVSGRLQRLQKLLNDSMMFLASYDIRQAQEHLTRLQAALETRRQQLQPNKKFAFKSRKKEAPAATAQPAPPVTRPKETPAEPADQCGLRGLSGQVLFMEAEEIGQKDVQLSQLRQCTITLRGSPATLHMRDLSGCKVLCGPVATSVFVDNCSDCLFTFPCQQLRTHSSTDCRFYLHVTSRAIIEDCSGLHFAPFTWSYPGIQRDYELTGLDQSWNNWDLVDDFNWLAMDVRSPNWKVIPEEERITHWN
ncbi:tubulin-specific chaperone C [Bufo gargarizans]|uniref:tubulin-specific chaperone C n=1 Tax=Bufo gargarizans TaxID=30331 RepID=UPI001CF4D648|nr:tubulin-specific chaperone C [Bufo gargarizans]